MMLRMREEKVPGIQPPIFPLIVSYVYMKKHRRHCMVLELLTQFFAFQMELSERDPFVSWMHHVPLEYQHNPSTMSITGNFRKPL